MPAALALAATSFRILSASWPASFEYSLREGNFCTAFGWTCLHTLRRFPRMAAPTAFPDPVAGARSAAASLTDGDCASTTAAADRAVCYHCGEPNPDGRWNAMMNGTRRNFCCAGCLAVAQTIHAAG